MHFGIISPPVPGHLHPFGALGRELIARGHRVSLIHMEDVRARAMNEGLQFLPVGHSDHPAGSLPASLAKLGQLHGFQALRFTIHAVARTTVMFCRDAPAVIRSAGVQALLVDQTEPVGCSLAEHLRIPFITVCNALNLNEEPTVPPPFTRFRYRDSGWARFRNRTGYRVARFVMSPVSKALAQQRAAWGLPAHRDASQSFSPLAEICQLPRAFDYPRQLLGPGFHYTGPLRRPKTTATPFPWARLNGKPLIYASLGTLQNSREPVFRIFAAACAELPVQLVITHGGGLDERVVRSLPGNPLVVSYAPQTELLARAALTLTHAGLNTVLDSLSCGVPLVAVPITYEQPAIAERLRSSGAGEVIPLKKLSIERLRGIAEPVLTEPRYRREAARIQPTIAQAGGVNRAADIVEVALNAKSTWAGNPGAFR